MKNSNLFKFIHDFKGSLRALNNLASWISEECAEMDVNEALQEYLYLMRKSVKDLNNSLDEIRSKLQDAGDEEDDG